MKRPSDKTLWLDRRIDRSAEVRNPLTAAFAPDIARQVQRFHRSLPGYRPTPLVFLHHLARRIGVGGIEVKDESKRFGLKAFKALGASYALCQTLAETLGLTSQTPTFDMFCDAGVRARLRQMTCITATDGNHGRAVAYTAQLLGMQAVVYMPEGSSRQRLDNIRRHGARAGIIAGNYDDAVKLAAEHARRNGWLLVQDTAWADYEEIPTRVMQGYLTLMAEIDDAGGSAPPTHVLLQCGVGSFPAAVQAYLVERWGPRRPICIVVEPTQAACFYQSAVMGDGRPHKVAGNLQTLMAGLACGEPSTIAWEILAATADVFMACPDQVTRRGMRWLARPQPGDPAIVSGESGAVTLGLLVDIMTAAEYAALRHRLQLDPTSHILLFSTEGDTDPDMYRKIVPPGENAASTGAPV